MSFPCSFCGATEPPAGFRAAVEAVECHRNGYAISRCGCPGEWLTAATRAYGQHLASVHLTGSRATGTHRPDSDWDLLITLEPLLYRDGRGGQLERRITGDRTLPRAGYGLDLFYRRPRGRTVACFPKPRGSVLPPSLKACDGTITVSIRRPVVAGRLLWPVR